TEPTTTEPAETEPKETKPAETEPAETELTEIEPPEEDDVQLSGTAWIWVCAVVVFSGLGAAVIIQKKKAS
ncbi:MAG: hypothetical protein IIX65_09495, partial [Lachnospiraceae bacterium]|nr:hypothetical protein [Lachnospiraceae bacterium]